jgi:hypothetical protein
MAVKDAHEGVQGNKEQCKMPNDQVQHVATALQAPPCPAKFTSDFFIYEDPLGICFCHQDVENENTNVQ